MAAKIVKRIQSVLKRARQAEKRELRNKSCKTKVKTFSKKVIAAIDTKDKEQIEKSLREAVKAISSASSKKVLHKNTASRQISRLTKQVNKSLKAATA